MIREITKFFEKNGIERCEAAAEAQLLVESISGFNKIDLILGKIIDDSAKKLIRVKAKERVETKKPIQYVLGKAYFMGREFFVDENTLIPRYETEILVKESIEIIQNNGYTKVLDIGTGSGCIACMLVKCTDAEVLAVDISKKALQVATKNAKNMALGNIEFIESDLFSAVNGKFDLIVSNPPYIPKKELNNLQSEVRNFEPQSALFADDENGLEFYERIIQNAKKYLNERGHILFELGIGQSVFVVNALEKYGFININIIKDLENTDRVVTASTFLC